MDDAEYVIVAYGGSVRSALAAMKLARKKGIKVGVLQLITVWPVADKEITKVLNTAKAVFVPELNLGQYIAEIQKYNTKNIPLVGINRVDSYAILPSQILEKIEEVADHG